MIKKNKPSSQALQAKYSKDLIAEWELYAFWYGSGAKPYLEPVRPIIQNLIRNAVSDCKQRRIKREIMRFKCPIGTNLNRWHYYSVSSLGRVVVHPPKNRDDLKPITSMFGAI